MIMLADPLLTEFSFTLPRGLVDAAGVVHRQGTMRLATARDELVASKHPQTRIYLEYLTIVLLSQVITQLGSLAQVTPEQLENLFTQDLAYLREIYNRMNQTGSTQLPVQCPQCSHQFHTELTLSGES